MFSVKSGQFILSGIDARNGAFGIIPEELDSAIISNDFWCFDINNKLIIIEYLDYLSKTDFFLSLCINASEGTTNRVRLQKDKFTNLEITLPSIEQQHEIVKKYKTFKTEYDQLTSEITTQEESIKNLKKSILQDAIKGKLVEQDPNDEPASELLKKIKTEKEKLDKSGKSILEIMRMKIKNVDLYQCL